MFLLSRMPEEYVRTGDSELSVADGLATTARVMAAAAIMVVVFGSFIGESDRIVSSSASASPVPCSSTRRSFGCCSCRPRWSFSETPTGGSGGSTVRCRGWPSRATLEVRPPELETV